MSIGAIREGRPSDGPEAGYLIREAGDLIMDALTASRNREETDFALAELWRREENRFSFKHARVFEENGRPVGLTLGYPHDAMARLDSGTARQLLKLRGLRLLLAALRQPLLAWSLFNSQEAEPGDWYLCVLATDPGCRGRGIGTALLEDAESRARTAGARALSLTVLQNNLKARRLYQHFGFRDRGPLRVGGFDSFCMVKEL